MIRITTGKSAAFIGIVFIAFAVASIPHLKETSYWAPDADRLRMDGVFLADFLKDLPDSALHPYTYTVQYYAKYPALSIGYRPAFFPLIEASFCLLFGYSTLSGKLAVLCFLFLGMVFWFRLVQETHDAETAVVSLLLWTTNPLVYQYAQYIMLEVPTLSMSILCTYVLYRYVRQPSVYLGVVLGVVLGLTAWTNQKGGFIFLAALLYPILAGKLRLFSEKRTWIAASIAVAFLVPLGVVTVLLGSQNLEQSLGGDWGLGRLSFSHLTKNIEFLYTVHLNLLVLSLAVLGIAHSILKERSKSLIYLSVIVSVYIFFTYIIHKTPRYSMYWIPYFCVFAAIGLHAINLRLDALLGGGRKWVGYGIYAIPLVFQLTSLPGVFVPHASGYEEAADYVVTNAASPVTFFDGYANGHFVFFIRVHDQDRRLVVLRGDKIVSSSSIMFDHKLEIHLRTKAEMLQTLREMGVQFVVVESRDVSGLVPHQEFRDLLKDPVLFRLHRSIPVKSNVPKLQGQRLLIYELLGWRAPEKGKMLKLRLPVVGQTIEVKMNDLVDESVRNRERQGNP